MHLIFRVAILLAALPLAACDDSEKKANALFVAAASTSSEAKAEPDLFKKFELLQDAEKKVSELLRDYPTSGSAVRIAANDPIGPFSRTALLTEISDLSGRPELCSLLLSRRCYLDIAAKSIDQIGNNPSTDPGRAVATAALVGWPYLLYLDPERERFLFSSLKEGANFRAALASQAASFSVPEFTRGLINAHGVDEAARFLRSIMDQGFRKDVLASAPKIVDAIAAQRTPQTNADVKKLLDAIGYQPPAGGQDPTLNQLCRYRYDATTVKDLLQACGVSDFLKANSVLPPMPEDTYEAIYAASAPDKKKTVAHAFYYAPNSTLDTRIAWYQRAALDTNPDIVSDLYVEALRASHPKREELAARLSAVKAMPVSAGSVSITTQAVYLMLRANTLKQQLPAIYQDFRQHPQYSRELERAIFAVIEAHRVDTTLPLEPMIDCLVEIYPLWPDDKKASRDAVLSRILTRIGEEENDVKPLLDRLFKNKPYFNMLGVDLLLNLKKHGHDDIYNEAYAKSPPLPAPEGIAFQSLKRNLDNAVEAGDEDTALGAINTLDEQARDNVIRNLIDNYRPLSPAREAFAKTLFDHYPIQVTSIRIGRNITGGDVDAMARVFLDNFDRVLALVGEQNLQWLTKNYLRFTPDTQRKLIATLARRKHPEWMSLAGAYLLTTESPDAGGALDVGQNFRKAAR